MAWRVGPVHDGSDFIGFNIIDATSERPLVSFSYSIVDDATSAHSLVAQALGPLRHDGRVDLPDDLSAARPL
jgi:hypothetical protein